ncbi:hypothetical protein IRJ41_011779 [Triplophysa rosa]|uniref:Uncharacterized protein n=1 Tax=Triplophysa rosa TaxID=992332 RepID=A0A9W7WKY9_TRIRA|nr:hypothetical protein IRJ41_011779 [Triplophysa rosa]
MLAWRTVVYGGRGGAALVLSSTLLWLLGSRPAISQLSGSPEFPHHCTDRARSIQASKKKHQDHTQLDFCPFRILEGRSAHFFLISLLRYLAVTFTLTSPRRNIWPPFPNFRLQYLTLPTHLPRFSCF